MIAANLAQVADWCDGTLQGRDRDFEGVSTDTRALSSGQLFVALQGDRFDGHEYVDAAAERAAAGIMIHRPVPTPVPAILVEDTRRSLGVLAAAWRERFGGRIAALTGSSGKTTVKEMLASILACRGDVLATRGNLNNDIGMPLTLLEARPDQDYLVLEMGANAAGDIAYLVGIARPEVALLINAGPAHLEGFGSLDGVAAAKGEIIAGLGADGVAVLNGDDPYAPLWRDLAGGRRRVEFGLGAGRDVRGHLLDRATNRVRLEIPGAVVDLTLSLPGAHNLMNALAAAAAAVALDIGAEAIRTGLESVAPVPGRLQRVPGRHGAVVIDDSYNANPLSLAAGLEALTGEPGARWLVLGDMKELGPREVELHREAGRLARQHGCTRLFAFGALAAHAAEGFGAGAERHECIDALREALDAALATAPGTVTLLVKGSRAMRLERLVAHLAAAEAQH